MQSLLSGLVVIPAAWLLLRPVELSLQSPLSFVIVTLLVAMFAGLRWPRARCSIDQTHIGLMFSLVLTPMIFFGCTYYPWSALDSFSHPAKKWCW